MKIEIPMSVPRKKRSEYKKNFEEATHKTGNLFLFAGDQKLEHLNDDFSLDLGYGNSDPEHLFKIANSSKVGVFASHLGLISRYGDKYKDIPYLVKLNGKSNLVKTKDPLSLSLWSVKDVVNFKKESKLKILGVGYTIYLGSEYEGEMLREASQIIKEAHKNGLISVLWIYPRGKNVENEKDKNLIAGAGGLGLCLGADFIKLNYPFEKGIEGAKKAKEITLAAGNSGVIFSGGSKISDDEFLELSKNQIEISGARGFAVGRNIHQNNLEDAIALADKLSEYI